MEGAYKRRQGTWGTMINVEETRGPYKESH